MRLCSPDPKDGVDLIRRMVYLERKKEKKNFLLESDPIATQYIYFTDLISVFLL